MLPFRRRCPEAAASPAAGCYVAWAYHNSTFCCIYPLLQELGMQPYVLLWLRYTAFIVSPQQPSCCAVPAGTCHRRERG